MTISKMLAGMLLLCNSVVTADAPKVRVFVWDERQPTQKEAYGDTMLGGTIAQHLAKNPGLDVRSMGMPAKGQTDNDPALTEESLDKADVLVWWGHVRHREVSNEAVERIVARVKAGKLSVILLHSAQGSKVLSRLLTEKSIERALASLPEADRAKAKVKLVPPPKVAKGEKMPEPKWVAKTEAEGAITLEVTNVTGGIQGWREDAKPGHLTTLLPDHPIAKGLPAKWDVSQTEMYNEPFHVPAPDALIFEERWDKGEYFRSGMLWSVGKGQVFYFRPGHETYPVFKEELPLRVIENACLFLGKVGGDVAKPH